MKRVLCASVVVFVSIACLVDSACYSATPSFKGIGFLPNRRPSSEATGVSGDGKVTVGTSYGFGFWWSEETGMLPTKLCNGGTASFNGSVVASTTQDWRAFKYTTEGGFYSVVSDGIDTYTISQDICADGSVIVGKTTSGGFIWKPSAL